LHPFEKELMTRHTFSLTGDKEYITLDKLLKLMRVVGSGGEAHAVISEGMVKVNGLAETQKRKKLRVGDKVEFDEQVIELVA
jgi:ribosome-associated protein